MNHWYLRIWLPLLVLLAGCSSQDFGRPIGRIGDVVDSGKSYVEDSSDEEALRRSSQLASILAEWERQKDTSNEDYALGADDVLNVGVLSLEAPDKVTTLTRTVSKDGTITLPLIGAIACAGSSARELQDAVTAAYSGKYLKDPQVDVAIVEYRSAPVVVTGAVGKPGVYYLRHNRSSVLEVLSMADGLDGEAGNSLLIVRRSEPRAAPAGGDAEAADTPATGEEAAAPMAAPAESTPEPWTGSHIVEQVQAMMDAEAGALGDAELDADASADSALYDMADDPAPPEAAPAARPDAVAAADAGVSGDAADPEADTELDLNADMITVDLRRLLDEGDMRLNLPVEGGDIVTVPPGRKAYIYVLGYVQRPGAFDLDGRERVRALQAVAMAGGLSAAARAQNSFLIIDNPSGRKVVSIDLTKIARGSRPPVYMEAGNTLVIGSGMFAKLAEFIKPSASVGANLTPGM